MKRELLFNESRHKYMDSFGNLYTSMTTVIGQYIEEFPKLKMAEIVSKKKDSKYYGWPVKAILADWDKITVISQNKGTLTHNYLEDITKRSTNFKFSGKKQNDFVTLYTIDDILDGSNLGLLDTDKYLSSGIKTKYPLVYKLFEKLSLLGYRFFSEIGVYHEDYLISGLIDILAINFDTNEFMIIDWKTNKHDLIPYDKNEFKWLSGYFKKDKKGNETNEFVQTNVQIKYPLSKYQSSHYVIYLMQLNGYATLVERRGFKLSQIMLIHIRDDKHFVEGDKYTAKYPELIGKQKVEIFNMETILPDMNTLFTHFSNGGTNQVKLLL
jgi:hypothetical protein